jgi:hypothetical protein
MGWVVSVTPRPRFTPREKGPLVPIVQEAGWAPVPVWTQRLQKKILTPLPGIEPRSPGRSVRSQTLYWLSYPAHIHILPHRYLKTQRSNGYILIDCLIDWLIDWTCRWSLTTSLNCSHQRAYCSSPRFYMSMENYGGILSTGKSPHSSTRALSGNATSCHLIASRRNWRREWWIFSTQYLFHTRIVL